MPKKFIDIIAPNKKVPIFPTEPAEPKPIHRVVKKGLTPGKIVVAFLFILIIGLIGGLIYLKWPKNQSKTAQLPNLQSSFDQNPAPKDILGAKVANPIKIKILNASDQTEKISQASALLAGPSFKIITSAQSANTYSETMVYYRSGQKALAEKVSQALAPSFAVKTQVSNVVEQNVDCLVILGQS